MADCSNQDCNDKTEKYQKFPDEGKLFENKNKRFDELVKKLDGQDGKIYIYVVDTVELTSTGFGQKGSGPNFQGDYITLCSCKHHMRTFRDHMNWENVWIAGFTNKKSGNHLFYLMRVKKAFDSQLSLWNDELLNEVRAVKNARRSRFGDVYEPLLSTSDKFDPARYELPCSKHVHCDNNEWHCDIDSDKMARRHGCKNGKYKIKAAMLLGDPDWSFIWEKQLIKKPRGNKKCCKCNALTRGQRVCDNMKKFLDCLKGTNK